MTEQMTARADDTLADHDDTGLALLLRRAAHDLQRDLRPALADHALTDEHWQVLAVLLRRPGIGMSELAHAAVLPAATLTRHMDRLVERALVVRRIDPDDKRRVVAALSPRGQEIAAEIRRAERTLEERWARRAGAASLAALVRGLPHDPDRSA